MQYLVPKCIDTIGVTVAFVSMIKGHRLVAQVGTIIITQFTQMYSHNWSFTQICKSIFLLPKT